MTGTVFVDTNVLIYAVDEADSSKQRRAQAWRLALWQSRRGRTSFQVLQEFYAKINKRWPQFDNQVRTEIRDLLAWDPVVINGSIIEAAWKIQDRYRLSFWDALIVGSARAADCALLLTEDLQADQILEGVRVINPFTVSPSSLGT
jgi:predicted nucleic acid-binding protein